VRARGDDGNGLALNRFAVERLGAIPRAAGRMTVNERARLRRLGCEPAGAVVHPDDEPVIGGGQHVEVAVAVDVGRKDVMRIDVVADRNLMREGVRVGRVRSR